MTTPLELTFLGRGSCFNTKEGNTSAYLKNGNQLFLFDCGENIFDRILKNNILEDINEVNIFITHTHSDHIGSLPSLIFYCHFIKNIPHVNIYNGDNLMQKQIYTFLELSGVSDEYYYLCQTCVRSLNNTYGFDMDIVISQISICHDAARKLQSFAFQISLYRKFDNDDDDDGLSDDPVEYIFYTGDTCELKLDIIKDPLCKIYYTDATSIHVPNNPHLSVSFLNDLVPSEYRNKVYCMHLDSDDTIHLATTLGFNVVTVQE